MTGQSLHAALLELAAIADRIHDHQRDMRLADDRAESAKVSSSRSKIEIIKEQRKAADLIKAMDFGPDFAKVMAVYG